MNIFHEVSEFLLFLMSGTVESVGLIACCLAVASVKLRWKIIMTIAPIFTVIIYLIRHIPVTFGLHTIAGILLLVMFMTKATRVPPSSSFLVSFVGFAILGLLERLIMELSAIVLKADISIIMSDYLLWKGLGLLQGMLLVLMALLIAKKRIPMEGMWRIH
ncbi:hypothetical protein SAMN05660649_03203 [Desulfotomaculum arcticum]|uniref:Uncharacterized protein n=1 Tax=Desulfotruncus arcticus DSM 17038 TaxID=1121424 RepID=A0A1I2W1J3_9FIRM|nr:hypothetical protein [Desulfotruncus arcticus]SFG93401.1 hypothetical protein SAMN05660649_03203 [Desulfotomaculum arcticum] [Desulfotruncus arcticus DSM 17038]